jgi:hypothetical protein
MPAKTLRENVFGFFKNAMYSIYKTNKKILPAHFDDGILCGAHLSCAGSSRAPRSPLLKEKTILTATGGAAILTV